MSGVVLLFASFFFLIWTESKRSRFPFTFKTVLSLSPETAILLRIFNLFVFQSTRVTCAHPKNTVQTLSYVRSDVNRCVRGGNFSTARYTEVLLSSSRCVERW
jgi:hypothetical protein